MAAPPRTQSGNLPESQDIGFAPWLPWMYGQYDAGRARVEPELALPRRRDRRCQMLVLRSLADEICDQPQPGPPAFLLVVPQV
jgi:hypothetical protein